MLRWLANLTPMASLLVAFIYSNPAYGQRNLGTPPGEFAFAIPDQFHGRWMTADAGCTDDPADIPTLIDRNGLRREEIWVEPVRLIDVSGDGLRLEMEADHYFEAPPVLHRSVWLLDASSNSLIVTDHHVESSFDDSDEAPSEEIHEIVLVRCDV